MKHIHKPSLGISAKRLFAFLVIFISISSAIAQSPCPIPFPKGDLDSTLRNVPVATVVTHNDISSFGSGQSIAADSLSIFRQPAHGTVSILNDSTIVYTPTPGYVGTDFYIYWVYNACGNRAQASVTIQVKPYCPAPVANDDRFTVYNNLPAVLSVTTNDVNVAGGPLKVTLLRRASNGRDTVIKTLTDGKIGYQGNAGYVGLDTIVYVVCDSCPSSNCDTASVYLNVVTCVSAKANTDTFTVQQQSSAMGDIAANDLNVSAFGNVSIAILSIPRFGSAVSLSGTTISYAAGITGSGVDSIKYRICTDCGCDTSYAVFTVTPKPCSKPVAKADNVFAGYSINCTNSFNVLANDTIPINGGVTRLTFVSPTPATFGTATIVNNTIIYTCTDSTKVGQIDLIKYSLCNDCFCDTGNLIINITNYPCNGLPPVANNDTVHVCRNYSVALNVTANDLDPEGKALTVKFASQPTSGKDTIISASNILYTPNSNFSGADAFTYQVCDAGIPSLCSIGSVVVIVDACAKAPVILNRANNSSDTLMVAVVQDSSLIYCFNVAIPDSPYVTINGISQGIDTVVTNGGSNSSPCIKITPPANSRAGDRAQVIICNRYPLCDTVTVIISIIPVNHPPVAVDDVVSYNWPSCNNYNVLLNDRDIDLGDSLKVTGFDSITPGKAMVTRGKDSILCYTPDSSFTGIDTVRYTICDLSGACSSAKLYVSVPIKARNDYRTIAQEQTTTIDVLTNDTKNGVKVTAICTNPTHGTATVSDSGVVYVPNDNYPFDPVSGDSSALGKDSFCYTICKVVGIDTSCTNAEVYILITPKSKFYIPQGISPNGDKVNDVFIITSSDEFPKSQLIVYNRWGDEVWRNDGDGYLNDFDGTWKKNGEPLPDGSYWYIFKPNDNKHEDRIGYIVIQR